MATDDGLFQVCCSQCAMSHPASLNECPFCGCSANSIMSREVPPCLTVKDPESMAEKVPAVLMVESPDVHLASWRQSAATNVETADLLRHAREKYSRALTYCVGGFVFVAFLLFIIFSGAGVLSELVMVGLGLSLTIVWIVGSYKLNSYRESLYKQVGSFPKFQTASSLYEQKSESDWRNAILEIDAQSQLSLSRTYLYMAIGCGVVAWLGAKALSLLLNFWFVASGKVVTLEVVAANFLIGPLRFAGLGFAFRLYAYSRFLKYRGAATPRLLAHTEPIVLLRSFADDRFQFWTTSQFPDIPLITSTWLMRLCFGFRITFEEALAGSLQRLSPLVTVGRPGDPTPRPGAARLWIRPEVNWQQVVERLTDRACLVVAIMTDLQNHPGSSWEVEHLLGRIDKSKLILVIPPVSESNAKQRWEQYQKHFPEMPNFVPYATTVAFNSDGAAHVTTARPNWLGFRVRNEQSYRIALEGRLVHKSISDIFQSTA